MTLSTSLGSGLASPAAVAAVSLGTASDYQLAGNPANFIYWTNFNGNSIGRANIDGSGQDQNFITGANSPMGIAVDSAYVY